MKSDEISLRTGADVLALNERVAQKLWDTPGDSKLTAWANGMAALIKQPMALLKMKLEYDRQKHKMGTSSTEMQAFFAPVSKQIGMK